MLPFFRPNIYIHDLLYCSLEQLESDPIFTLQCAKVILHNLTPGFCIGCVLVFLKHISILYLLQSELDHTQIQPIHILHFPHSPFF